MSCQIVRSKFIGAAKIIHALVLIKLFVKTKCQEKEFCWDTELIRFKPYADADVNYLAAKQKCLDDGFEEW